MIVYVDLIFISNFVIEFIFLYLVNILFKEKPSMKRITLASFASCFILLAFFLNYFFFVLFKIFGGILIFMIANKFQDINKSLVKLMTFYIVNLSFVGILSSFEINNYLLLLLGLFVVITAFIIENNKKYYIFIKNNTYNVTVIFDGEIIQIDGFIDTGNFSLYLNCPIIYIDERYMPKNIIPYNLTYVTTISGIDKIKLYKPKSIVVENKSIDAYICFTKLKEVNCLLNANIFI